MIPQRFKSRDTTALTVNIQRTLDSSLEAEFSRTVEEAQKVLNRERAVGKIKGARIYSGLVELETPQNLAIVGDLHGDLTTLRTILNRLASKNFLKDSNNKIVFLGDYVDRGRDSIGVLFTLLRLKCSYPDSVILMRGNHEAPVQFPFSSHSFPLDLQTSFTGSKGLYQEVLSLFELFSLVTVVKNRLILVHGGLPIEDFGGDAKIVIAKASINQRVLEEILWNDPRDFSIDGLEWEKSGRKYGGHFGERVSIRWLKVFGARVIVRGHEPCLGFKILHGDKVMTLFSCKEAYPAFEPAFIKISKEQLVSVNRASDLAKYVKSPGLNSEYSRSIVGIR